MKSREKSGSFPEFKLRSLMCQHSWYFSVKSISSAVTIFAKNVFELSPILGLGENAFIEQMLIKISTEQF